MCEAWGLSANALSTAGDSGRKASTASVAKKFLEPLRRQRGIARCVLNVAVTEIGLDSARIVAIVGELVALMPRSAAMAARYTAAHAKHIIR
jgi:hypothetical protein